MKFCLKLQSLFNASDAFQELLEIILLSGRVALVKYMSDIPTAPACSEVVC